MKLELPASAPIRLDMTGFAATASGMNSLISTYYDTPDQKLRKAGFSLRVRKSGRRYVQTVKSQAGAAAGWYVRPEWETDIAGARPVLEAAGPLPKMFGQNILHDVRRMFVTEVERKVHKISLEGTTIMVADDCGEVRVGSRGEPIREVELELDRGDPHLLFMLARQLGDQVPVRLGVRSKSERGYDLLDRRAERAFKAEPIALDADESSGAAFERIAQSCIRQFRLNETLLLENGAPEPVHQARVGLRRLRSAFSVFGTMLKGDEHAALLRADLRWLSGTLGKVRDLDVLIPRLSDEAKEIVTAARKDAYERAIEEVDSARTRFLMLDLAEWLAFGGWRTAPGDGGLVERDIGSTAPGILDARRKKLRHHGRHLRDISDESRHEVRKEAKKLRYAAEFFASLYAAEPAHSGQREFLKKLESVQDRLGELNDLATVPELLAGLGVKDVALTDLGNRSKLLEQSHHAFAALMDVRKFWQ